MIKRIAKAILPKKIYELIKKIVFIKTFSKQIKAVQKKNEFCIVFIATPGHGNLGDQAIVYAQERFFTDHGFKNYIVEIESTKYENYSKEIKKYIRNNDLIVIDGGGSMGTLWPEVEYKMQNIVNNFPENPIFIFPQTIFYTDDNNGRRELQQSIESYSEHKNLHICAREKASYNFMKKVYPTVDILFIPDMVLYLNDIQVNNPRNGALLCMRNDKEKQLNNNKIKNIIRQLEAKGLKIKDEPTVIMEGVPKKKRVLKLNEKWDSFSRAQIVITDRLHGMIFAAITGTPCIAFNNSSGKVGNVYQWIKNLSYIHFISDDSNISEVIENLLNCNNNKYDNTELKPYYDNLFNAIKESMNRS